MNDYEPREGTVPARVIEHLQSLEPGAKLTSVELATVLGVSRTGMAAQLKLCVARGLLHTSAEGRLLSYFLPPVAERNSGPLEINSDSTGDLWFDGATVDESGRVLLCPEQLQQLVEYATTPPLKLQPRARGIES